MTVKRESKNDCAGIISVRTRRQAIGSPEIRMREFGMECSDSAERRGDARPLPVSLPRRRRRGSKRTAVSTSR